MDLHTINCKCKSIEGFTKKELKSIVESGQLIENTHRKNK